MKKGEQLENKGRVISGAITQLHGQTWSKKDTSPKVKDR